MARAAPRELPKNIGRYEVVRPLGIGAMGRVLLARDPVLERHVAIKILRDDLLIGADVRDSLLVRMRHEARAAARVTHPNLVVIHDMGEDDDLGLYLVFEYIEGPTLKQRLLEGRLSARQAARMGREIGAALSYAHERGVLHRDVKPENIILSPTGSKLTDFGIARVPDSTLTHLGGILGTPAYSAPETFRDSTFSPESDQFALAATLYEAIRGARAFPGDDAVSVAARIANDEPEPFAQSLRYPPALDAHLARGMSKDPTARFDSCKTLGAHLMDALLAQAPKPLEGDKDEREEAPASLPFSSSATSTSIPPPPRKAPSPWLYGAAALAGLLLFGFIVRALFGSGPEATNVASAAVPIAPVAASIASASTSGSAVATASTKPPRKPRVEGARPTPSGSSSAAPSSSSAAPSSSAPASASASASASTSASASASTAPHATPSASSSSK